MFASALKGQERLFVVDVESKDFKWFNFLGKSQEQAHEGEYELQRLFEDQIIVKYSECSKLPKIYSVIFKNTTPATLTELLHPDNLLVTLVDELKFNSTKSELESQIANIIPTFTKELITLENGA